MSMYKIVSDENFTRFKAKISKIAQLLSDNNHIKNYIDCIGHNHTVNYFKMNDDSQVEISFRHKFNNNLFRIIIKFVKISYDIDIKKNNRCYDEYINDQQYNNNKSSSKVQISSNIAKENVQLFGITVGDLLKHFYYNSREEGKDQTQLVLDLDPNNYFSENEKIFKLLRKVPLIDTSINNSKNVLGLYTYYRQLIYLWEENLGNFISKSGNDFDSFCKKLVYFSESDIISLFVRTKDKIDIICEKLFNEISGKTVVMKLFKYFLYNENPEFGLIGEEEIITFDEPTSIPDILQYLYQQDNNNFYLDLYNKIMKKLNAHQLKELESKYQPIVFTSIAQIPQEYPFFALKNIYVTQWSWRGYKNDYNKIKQFYNTYMQSVKNSKYKHKSMVSNKTILVEQRFPYYRNDISIKGKYKNKCKELRYIMDKELDNLDDIEETKSDCKQDKGEKNNELFTETNITRNWIDE